MVKRNEQEKVYRTNNVIVKEINATVRKYEKL